MLRIFFNRMREPSSLAGLAVLGALFGADPVKVNAATEALAAILAAGAVLLPESRK